METGSLGAIEKFVLLQLCLRGLLIFHHPNLKKKKEHLKPSKAKVLLGWQI